MVARSPTRTRETVLVACGFAAFRAFTEGANMSLHMALIAFSAEAASGIRQEGAVAREQYLTKLISDQGGRVVGYYYIAGGEWDQAFIVDMPDDVATAAWIAVSVLNGQGAGIYRDIRNYRLCTAAEIDAAFANATQLRAPGT